MKTRSFLPLIAAVLIVALALAFAGYVPDPVNGVPVLIGMAAAAPARTGGISWGRKREPLKTFNNVAAGTAANPNLAYSYIPRLRRTVLGIMLERGGTTFTDTHLPRIELFLGETSIYGPVSATNLRVMERYINGRNGYSTAPAYSTLANDPYHLPIPLSFPNVKEIGAEFVGGLDLEQLPEGQLRLEVDVGAATAPTLRGEIIWGPPQGQSRYGRVMQKVITRTYPSQAAGDFYPEVNVRGAILARQFWRYTVTTAAVSTAGNGEGVANTGDGAMGALAVAANTPTGRYRLVCIEPAANAGRFALFGPDYLGAPMLGTVTVAVAFDIGGISGTLADGATDFVAGDGFRIDVLPLNTDGNLNAIELQKDDESGNVDRWYFQRCRAARKQQLDAGRLPLAGLFVSDYLQDNHGDSFIDTAVASALDYRLNLTATDTVTVLHQVLADPLYMAKQRQAA